MLKEGLAAVLNRRQVNVAREKLGEWISWALRSRLEPLINKAAKTIRDQLDSILAYIQTGFSNGRAEGLNGRIRTITKRSFGFHRPASAREPDRAHPSPLLKNRHHARSHGSASTRYLGETK
jgi:transposase